MCLTAGKVERSGSFLALRPRLGGRIGQWQVAGPAEFIAEESGNARLAMAPFGGKIGHTPGLLLNLEP